MINYSFMTKHQVLLVTKNSKEALAKRYFRSNKKEQQIQQPQQQQQQQHSHFRVPILSQTTTNSPLRFRTQTN